MKIEIYTAVSVDGFISGIDGDESWILDENGSNSFDNYAKTFDAIILGRNTFNRNLGTVYPVKDTKNIVMTSSFIDPDKYEENFEFTNKNPKELIQELKNRNYKNIMIVGGAKIYEAFLKEKLVDEILIALHPNILGGGISLTSNLTSKINLEEINCEDSEEGFKLIRYKIKY